MNYTDSLLLEAAKAQIETSNSLFVIVVILAVFAMFTFGVTVYALHRLGKLQKQLESVERAPGFTRQTAAMPQS